jgi:hypothetical protein
MKQSTIMTDNLAMWAVVSSRRGRAALTAMFVAVAAAGVALAPPAAALHLEQYIEVPQCQPATSQVCAQSPEVRFTAGQDDLQVQFTANANHCSDILVRFNVDNYPQGDWLQVGPGQTVSYPSVRTSGGDHVLSVTAKGIDGGCNTGVLNSWGGTVRIDSADAVGPAPHPVAAPTPQPCKWAHYGAVVIDQDNGIRVDLDQWEDLTAIGPVHLYAPGATVQSNHGELIGAGGAGTKVSFTIAWFDKNNRYATTNDYTGNIDPTSGALRRTTVNNEGVSNEWVAHEHFTCA